MGSLKNQMWWISQRHFGQVIMVSIGSIVLQNVQVNDTTGNEANYKKLASKKVLLRHTTLINTPAVQGTRS
jgi:hypothetical protein